MFLFRETSPSGNERGERSVFAGWVVEQFRCPFCFILLLFPVHVNVSCGSSGLTFQ